MNDGQERTWIGRKWERKDYRKSQDGKLRKEYDEQRSKKRTKEIGEKEKGRNRMKSWRRLVGVRKKKEGNFVKGRLLSEGNDWERKDWERKDWERKDWERKDWERKDRKGRIGR